MENLRLQPVVARVKPQELPRRIYFLGALTPTALVSVVMAGMLVVGAVVLAAILIGVVLGALALAQVLPPVEVEEQLAAAGMGVAAGMVE